MGADEPDPRHWLYQLGKPAEDDLASWGHHEGSADVPDDALKFAGANGLVRNSGAVCVSLVLRVLIP